MKADVLDTINYRITFNTGIDNGDHAQHLILY